MYCLTVMNLKLLIARREKGLTQNQLAAEAGITQADVSRIEKQGWIPPAEIRQRVAGALETTPERLFEVSDHVAS